MPAVAHVLEVVGRGGAHLGGEQGGAGRRRAGRRGAAGRARGRGPPRARGAPPRPRRRSGPRRRRRSAASRSGATAGRRTSSTSRTQAARSPRRSGGTAWSASSVGDHGHLARERPGQLPDEPQEPELLGHREPVAALHLDGGDALGEQAPGPGDRAAQSSVLVGRPRGWPAPWPGCPRPGGRSRRRSPRRRARRTPPPARPGPRRARWVWESTSPGVTSRPAGVDLAGGGEVDSALRARRPGRSSRPRRPSHRDARRRRGARRRTGPGRRWRERTAAWPERAAAVVLESRGSSRRAPGRRPAPRRSRRRRGGGRPWPGRRAARARSAAPPPRCRRRR